jgi:polypeptide N-acetylgalactosaminyltransferase
MKARMLGAVNAKGPALIFMDSHMEVYPGWLEPLLDRLVQNNQSISIAYTVNCNRDTLGLECPHGCENAEVTGFNWDMTFRWKWPYEPEGKKRQHQQEPVASPTMLGAFFGKFLMS